jgi:hypothetical protein
MSTIPLYSDVYPAIDYSVTAGTLANKVGVIAGASRGIGQQIAHSLAKAGANVALLSLSGENTETKRLCEQEGVKVVSWKVDFTVVPVQGDCEGVGSGGCSCEQCGDATTETVRYGYGGGLVESGRSQFEGGEQSIVGGTDGVAYVYDCSGFTEYEGTEFGVYHQHWISSRDCQRSLCDSVFHVQSRFA